MHPASCPRLLVNTSMMRALHYLRAASAPGPKRAPSGRRALHARGWAFERWPLRIGRARLHNCLIRG